MILVFLVSLIYFSQKIYKKREIYFHTGNKLLKIRYIVLSIKKLLAVFALQNENVQL